MEACLKRPRRLPKGIEPLKFVQNKNYFVKFLNFENLNNFGAKVYMIFR